MKITIENWSAPSLIPRARVRERCEEVRKARGDFSYFEVDGGALDTFPFFRGLVGETAITDPVLYILKLRPADIFSCDPFLDWLNRNSFEPDYDNFRSRRRSNHIPLHGDFYGLKLRRLMRGELQAPLTPSEIAAFQSVEIVKDSIRRSHRHSNQE